MTYRLPNKFASIRAFIDQVDRFDIADDVIIDWNRLLEDQGYVKVALPSCRYFPPRAVRNFPPQAVRDWCCDQFGEDHFTWTGRWFWFETEEAAMLFLLRWAR